MGTFIAFLENFFSAILRAIGRWGAAWKKEFGEEGDGDRCLALVFFPAMVLIGAILSLVMQVIFLAANGF